MKSEKQPKAEKPLKTEKPAKSDKNEKPAKNEKNDKTGKTEKAAKSEKSAKSGKDTTDKAAKDDKASKPGTKESILLLSTNENFLFSLNLKVKDEKKSKPKKVEIVQEPEVVGEVKPSVNDEVVSAVTNNRNVVGFFCKFTMNFKVKSFLFG